MYPLTNASGKIKQFLLFYVTSNRSSLNNEIFHRIVSTQSRSHKT